MSSSYFLTCLDCKTGVNLGKAIHASYPDCEVSTYGFNNLGSSALGEWKPSLDNLINVQHFLMLHRGHELRVLPDTAEKYANDIGFPHSWPDSNDDLDENHNRLKYLEQKVLKPSPENELDILPQEVIEKLKTF